MEGPGVTFFPLPDYLGPVGYARCLRELKAGVRAAVAHADAFLLRSPGAIPNLVYENLSETNRPYGVEVLSDPGTVFSPKSIRTPLRPLFRHTLTRMLRNHCRDAAAVLYVTERALQKLYPIRDGAYEIGCSDVDLTSGFANEQLMSQRAMRLQESCNGKRPLRIGFVGTLAQHYKGPDVLLEALACCSRAGMQFVASVAGDGRFKHSLETYANKLGLGSNVKFLGALPSGMAVIDFLDSTDLFLLPSRAEGLPRALVEAMSRGCACISTDVCGIPELLPPEALVRVGDSRALADRILKWASDVELMQRMAALNVDVARRYAPDVLSKRHEEFLQELKNRSRQAVVREGWLKSSECSS